MSSDQERRDPVGRLFGALLMAVGALMMALCGLCSLAAIVYIAGSSDAGGTLLLVLVFGGVPIAVGFGIFWLGLQLRRPRDR